MNLSALPAIDFSALHAWFDIAPDAMIAVDQEGTIVLANAQAAQMFDYGHGALHGCPLETLLPESLRMAHVKHRSEYMTHPRVRPMGIGYQLMGARRDGSSFPVEIGLSPIQTEKGTIAIASPDHLMDASVPLKSKRWPTSRAAWLSALSTSCRSTLLTMSKELSDAMLQSCQHLLAIALACGWRRPSLNRAQPRRQGPPESGCRCRACAQFRESGRVGSHPSVHDGRASFAKTGHSANVIPRWFTAMAACPSGQRERSVKPSATPTMVRIHQLPRKDPVDSSTGSLILLAVIERSCSRPA